MLLGERYREILEKSLNRLGYDTIPIADNPYIESRVSAHADLSLFFDGTTVFAADYLKTGNFCEKIKNSGIKISFIDVKQAEKYPDDCGMNICPFGNRYIYNPKTAAQCLIEHLNRQGREGIECRQGYTRCSVCIVDSNSIITADTLIAKNCRKMGLEVLEILPGYIKLDGFEYGFIGGASINLEPELLAFTGTLEFHPQQDEILSFIESRGVEIEYLTRLPAFDIGSAHVIKTESQKE